MFLLPLQLPSAHQLLSNSLCNYQQILGGFVKTLLLFYLSFPTQVALALFQVISLDNMILIQVLSLWAIIFGLVQLLAFGRNLCWQVGLKIVLHVGDLNMCSLHGFCVLAAAVRGWILIPAPSVEFCGVFTVIPWKG